MKANLIFSSVLIVFFLMCIAPNKAMAQHEDDSLIVGTVVKRTVEIRDPNFLREYNYLLKKMKRIYPLATHAKGLLDQYEKDVNTLDKKRQIKKYGKTAHKKLMDDFEYIIRDMYISDGQLLTKLIHRQTGLTVHAIVKKYRGGATAVWYQGMGKLFEQNTKTEFKPEGKDWMIELIAKEIEEGKHKTVPFKYLSKKEFKTKNKAEKKKRKENSKQRKEVKKKAKK